MPDIFNKHNFYVPRPEGVSVCNLYDYIIPHGKPVVIVGTAASGSGFYEKIPPEAYTIALNGAIKIEGVRWDAWCVADYEVTGLDYFKEHEQDFKGVYLFNRDIMHKTWAYTYARDRILHYVPQVISERYFRREKIFAGAGVAGIALHIAFNNGYSPDLGLDARFLGVELRGNAYIDGVSDKHKPGKDWACLENMQTLVNWLLKIEGVSIASYSETAIDIPRVGVDFTIDEPEGGEDVE